MAVRRGFSIVDGEEWLPRDKPEEITLDAADRAIEAQRIYRAKYIIGDANGVGRGAMEYLHRHFNDPERKHLNVRVIFFNSGSGASDSTRYHRRRDEMWFRRGREFFANSRSSLPRFPRIMTQLTTPGYYEDAGRRIQVETKDQVFKRTRQPSGNLADAILQSLMVHTETAVEPEKPVEEGPPEVFKRLFARWAAKRGDSALIR
jgi:hypothetical protein